MHQTASKIIEKFPDYNVAECGCIHFDDYNFREWPGNKKAIKEFEKQNKFSFSYEVPLGGYYIIK